MTSTVRASLICITAVVAGGCRRHSAGPSRGGGSPEGGTPDATGVALETSVAVAVPVPEPSRASFDEPDAGPVNVIAKLSTVAGPLRVLDVGAARGEAFEACQYDVELQSRVVF